MKNKILNSLLLLIVCHTTFGNDFLDFINLFPTTSNIINTRQFYNLPQNWEAINKLIPSNYALKFFCENDTNKLKYDWELVSQDENEITESGRSEHLFYAFARFNYNKIICLVYLMTSPNTDGFADGFYLSLFNKEGEELERILIENRKGDAECFSYLFSVVNMNLDIEQFTYELNYSGKTKNHKIDDCCDISILFYRKMSIDSNFKFKDIVLKKYSGKYSVCEYEGEEKDDDFAKILYNAR